MSREIKFRAWNKKEGYFTKNIGFQQYSNGKVELWENPVTREVLNSEDFVIQQFTGLQDKNGVDAYEGDILENSQNLHEVFFENGTFESRVIKVISCGHTYSATGLKFSTYKIVGNIFENPELIEK